MSSNITSKPFTYLGLKCVLQYMEANLRIKLTQHLPSIRTAELSSPLNIDYLHIQPYQVNINHIIYRLGVIRTCQIDWLMHQYLDVNEYGESNDINEYGESDKTLMKLVLPGDIVMDWGVPRRKRAPANTEQKLRMLLIRKGLEHPDQNFPVELAQNTDPEDQEEEDDSDVIDPRADLLLDRYNKIKRRQASEVRLVNKYQELLLQKHLRQDNAVSPFTNYLQLTVLGEEKRKEHVVYEKRILEAMKYLMNRIFGGRPGVINVKNFCAFAKQGVYRIPEGLKLRIQNLHIDAGNETAMKCLNPIIDKSSFPLKSVDLNGPWLLFQLIRPQLPMVENAEKLILSITGSFQLNGTIFIFPNREVHCTLDQLTKDELVTFIRTWLGNPRGVGKRITFKLHMSILENVLQMVKELPGAEVVETNDSGSSFITFPFNQSSALRVSAEKIEERKGMFRTLKFEEVDHFSSNSI